MNRALFPSQTQYHALQVPPNDLLGQSEVSQMEAKIDSFVKAFKVGIHLSCRHRQILI